MRLVFLLEELSMRVFLEDLIQDFTKVAYARQMGRVIDIDSRRSPSFNHLMSAIQDAVQP